MTQRLAVDKTVLVVGDAPEAGSLSEALVAQGYQVLRLVAASSDIESSGRLLVSRGRHLDALEGHVGRFRAGVSGGGARSLLSCSAVVVATGNERYYPAKRYGLVLGPRILSVPQMADMVAAGDRPASWRRKQRVALVLDWDPAGGRETARETAAEALELAVQVRRAWHAEVTCYYQNLKVDTYNTERLTRDMRECGVVFARYDELKVTTDDEGVDLVWAEGEVRADLLVLPEAVRPAGDTGELARALGVHVGADGYFQDVNIHHYRPGLSSRRGVFFSGRCHMDGDARQIADDVAQAVANVDALLGSGEIESEDEIAQVDPNVCIRCLTCVRTCPHAAAEIAEYRDASGSSAVTAACVDVWACRGCGACVANCPVQAIKLVIADEAAREVLALEERVRA